MSFENKLNQRLISEASLDDVGAAAAKRGLRKKKPQEFADVRKALRRPMVQLDAAVHQIDKFLNTTQQDPSRLDSTVAEIEKAFNSLFEPLKAVRAGVQNLRLSANTMKSAGFEYAGQGEKPATPAPQQAAQGNKPGVDENRFFNRVATSIEAMNRQEDKMMAAKQGFEAYQQQGGKMNRGEFMRALVQRLRPPAEKQPALPSDTGAKQYGQQGRRRGELQYHPARTSPIESYAPTSVQRRILREAGFGSHGDPISYDPVISNTAKSSVGSNKQYNLGKLPVVPNEDRLINKIVTEIEMVNNHEDKKMAFRNGWLDYQNAGGALNHSEFVKSVTNKLKMARSNPAV